MNNRINEAIRALEKEHEIKILLASESGSRAWGFASPDSDWDVRFIYVHKPEWYYSIKPKADTIEKMLDNRELDLAGWELRKTLGLMMKTNPALVDWLYSPDIYYADEVFLQEIRKQNMVFYHPIGSIGHFLALSRGHYERYLSKETEGYTLKHVLYYLRSLLCCRWVEAFETHPPVRFSELVEVTVPEQEVKDMIKVMLAKKAQSREYNKEVVDIALYNYARGIQTYFEELLPHYKPKKMPCGKEADLSRLLMAMVDKYK